MIAAPLLVVWPEYPPAVGGMQVHGFEFAKFLRDGGVPFTLLTRIPATAREAQEAARFDALARIPARRILPPHDFSEALRTLTRVAREVRPHAVYSSQIAFAPAFKGMARVICRSAGNDVLRPWVGPCDVSRRVMASVSDAEGWARVRANAEWIRQAAESCEHVLCNSEWTAAQLRGRLAVSATVVHGGVDVRRFRPVPRERFRAHLPLARGRLLAVIAARHVLKKGIDVALEAVASLDDRVRLIIAGRGPETSRLLGQQRRLGLLERVRFAGPIDHATLPWLLGMADVVLAPSRSIYDPRRFGIDHETMCRVACEAAACGTPVIGSDCGGIPEIVRHGETGLLAHPGDARDLAAKIDRLAADAEGRASLSARARQWAVDELSFDKVNRITLACLTSDGTRGDADSRARDDIAATYHDRVGPPVAHSGSVRFGVNHQQSRLS